VALLSDLGVVMHAPGNARRKVVFAPRAAMSGASRDHRSYRALVILTGLGILATGAMFLQAAINPAPVRAWLPLLGPLAGASVAVAFGIIANLVRSGYDQRRAARATSRMADEPELAREIAELQAALLRERDERA